MPRIRGALPAFGMMFLLLVSACGGEGCSIVSECPAALTAVSLAPPSATLQVGQTLLLTATPTKANGAVTVEYSYSTSATNVATVSTAGVVSAVSPGTATITVTASGSGAGLSSKTHTAVATITVSALPDAIRGATLTPSTGSIRGGEALVLAAAAQKGGDAVSVSYAFSSNTPTVATVGTNDGIVTGVAPGTAVISVTAMGSGTGFTANTATATATITVLPFAVTSLTVSASRTTVPANQTAQLIATATPGGAGVSIITTYESSRNDIATVSASGLVTAVSAGTSILRVRASGSGAQFTPNVRTDSVAIIVTPVLAVTSVSVSASRTSVPVNETSQLTVTVATAGPGVTTFTTYESSRPDVATVSASGLITAVSTGTAVLRVRASGSGGGFTANAQTDSVTISVTPVNAVSSLSVSANRTSLAVGEVAQLAQTIVTAGPAVTVTTTTESSRTDVATVSGTGRVTAVAPGTTVITVRASGSGGGFTPNSVEAQVTINVAALPNALTELTLTQDVFTVPRGQQVNLSPHVTAGAGVTVTYEYVSNNLAVATVNAGLVTAVGTGTTQITVKATGAGAGYTTNELQRTATITVTSPAALISVSVADARTVVGQALTLAPVVTPAAAGVMFTISYPVNTNPAVATVSSAGVVTGVSLGTTRITVRATGSGTGFVTTTLEAIATITVSPPLATTLAFATIPCGLDNGCVPPTPFTPVTTTGGLASLNFQVFPALPTGLQMNSNTGVVTGSPSVGSHQGTYTVTVSDGLSTSSKSFTMSVMSSILVLADVVCRINQPCVRQICGYNGGWIGPDPVVTVSPALPIGLHLFAPGSDVGAVEGTPLVLQASKTYTMTYTDFYGRKSSKDFTITITP